MAARAIHRPEHVMVMSEPRPLFPWGIGTDWEKNWIARKKIMWCQEKKKVNKNYCQEKKQGCQEHKEGQKKNGQENRTMNIHA